MRLIASFCLFLVSSCASFNLDPPERKIIPNDRTGCSEFRGVQKAQCVSAIIEAYQDFRNADVVKTKISERRHNEYWVIVTYQYCFVVNKKTFDCFQDENPEKDRTFMGAVQEHLITGLPAYVLGIITGIQLK
jgi:hypothetical protein